ncbi:MAG: helix-turn-helix domain-containing protein [Bacteroidales bacterium]|nr:helix-turn-helix domain-containing protein [Bacteroidales bacterium]
MIENPFEIIIKKLIKIETRLSSIEVMLEELGLPNDLVPEYLTVKLLSDLIHLKESTIYSLVSKNRIPVSRQQGRRLIFSRKEITEWVESGRQKTIEEIKDSINENLK